MKTRPTTPTASNDAATVILLLAVQACLAITADAFVTLSGSTQRHHATDKCSPVPRLFQCRSIRLKSSRNRSSIRTQLYRKFHDYGWKQLTSDDDTEELDTVPEQLRSNSSPVKGKGTPGTNVVADIRSVSKFPRLSTNEAGHRDEPVLRLARSALLETQLPSGEAAMTPSAIHVLNFVLFPSPHIRDQNQSNDDASDGYLGLPIFGADIVSLPGNKHLVALDFQPVLPLDDGVVGANEKEPPSLFPRRYSHLEEKLAAIHAKYQNKDSDPASPLPWGGDIPPQARRFFSPYALWTRLGDKQAAETVNTVVWRAFRDYADLYVELMHAVQADVHDGKLQVVARNDGDNAVSRGQIEYLEYRRANDPARPMLQRLYGHEWAESVIETVLFPDLI